MAAVIVWGVLRKNDPEGELRARKAPDPGEHASTNGEVEPSEWQSVRAETRRHREPRSREEGQVVAAGAVLAGITDRSLQSDIDTAQAGLNEAQAELSRHRRPAAGPPTSPRSSNSLARAQLDLEQAKRLSPVWSACVAQHAATQQDVDTARQKVQEIELEISGLSKRRGSLVSPTQVTAARARVGDAETALALARQRASLLVVRSPIAGVVYGREVRAGSFRQRRRSDRQRRPHGSDCA